MSATEWQEWNAARSESRAAVALALAPYGAQWRAPFLSVDALAEALNATRAVAVGVATRHACGNVTVQSRDAEGLVTRYLLGFEPRIALPVD